jgi:hypothetical protein
MRECACRRVLRHSRSRCHSSVYARATPARPKFCPDRRTLEEGMPLTRSKIAQELLAQLRG